MNTMKKEAEKLPEDVELLLPWHAAGTLSRRDAARVEQALANDNELAARYDMVREELGEAQAVLACDCVLRNLEITQNGSKPAVEQIFQRNRVVGFSTYGEQFGGVHVNQTLTAIAFGTAPGDRHD